MDLLAGFETALPNDGEPFGGFEGADNFAAKKHGAAETPVVGRQGRVGVTGAEGDVGSGDLGEFPVARKQRGARGTIGDAAGGGGVGVAD